MNKADRKELDDILQSMEEKKTRLEEIQSELEDRSTNLEDHFPVRAEVIREEADRAMDIITSLEEVIQGLEDSIVT